MQASTAPRSNITGPPRAQRRTFASPTPITSNHCTAGTAGHNKTPLRACPCPSSLDFFPSIQWEKSFAVGKDEAAFCTAAVPASTREQSIQNHRKGKIHAQNLHGKKISFFFLFFTLFCLFMSKTSIIFCSFLCFSTHALSRKLNAMQMKRVGLGSSPRAAVLQEPHLNEQRASSREKREQEMEELPGKYPTSDLSLRAKR